MNDVDYWRSELRNRRAVAAITAQSVTAAHAQLRLLEADDRKARSKVAEAEEALRRAEQAGHRK
jgi:hypothetical protein